jgi:hypothetical protein
MSDNVTRDQQSEDISNGWAPITKRRGAEVWKHFETGIVNKERKIKCIHCSKVLAFSTTTKDAISHLKSSDINVEAKWIDDIEVSDID